jgi:hypothetical protein
LAFEGSEQRPRTSSAPSNGLLAATSRANFHNQPKQKTPNGLEIPVPKRKELMDAFRKVVGAPIKEP